MILGIVGTGRMARAIVTGVLAREIFRPQDILGTARTAQTRRAFLDLAPKGELRWVDTIEEVAQAAQILLLAVKPQQLSEILPHIKVEENDPLYISIMAGVSISRLESSLASRARLVRAMPNMPVQVGYGVTAFASNSYATKEDINVVEKIFKAVGKVYQVQESQMNVVTALSGAGPAYFYLFVDYLARAAVEHGLDLAQARSMAAQTALGAAQMLLQTNSSPQGLIEQVRSKAGVTQAALEEFERQNFDQLCEAVIKSACARAHELTRFSL